MTYIRGVPQAHQGQAQRALAEGRAVGILVSAGNERGLDVVLMNHKLLLERGIYEEALLEAYTSTRVNWSHWTPDELLTLFRIADREKLQAAGDPLPQGDPFTLYRGVAGDVKHRRPQGLSWTRSLEKARWFASRFGLEAPVVYRATVPRSQVFAYSNGRGEDDFLVWIEEPERLAREGQHGQHG